ncbi:cysteine dioxygenase, partial [Streptomyces sp. SID7499]|nr:cysteine dioxygenase [Streptomyces sp. SID7499]
MPTAAAVPSPSAPVTGGPATSSTAPTVAELMDFVRSTARDEALIASLPLDPEGR